MYYNVMTITVMVILNSFSLKEKQNDRYDQSYVHGRRKICSPEVQQGRAHTIFGISTWNLSELVRTRFHGSMIFHSICYRKYAALVQPRGVEVLQ
jgi:hypothetical protein